MKTIITALFFAFAFASCDKESYNQFNNEYQVNNERHYAELPDYMVGTWYSKQIVNYNNGELYKQGTITLSKDETIIDLEGYKKHVFNYAPDVSTTIDDCFWVIYIYNSNGDIIDKIIISDWVMLQGEIWLKVDGEVYAILTKTPPVFEEPEQTEQPTEPETPINLN